MIGFDTDVTDCLVAHPEQSSWRIAIERLEGRDMKPVFSYFYDVKLERRGRLHKRLHYSLCRSGITDYPEVPTLGVLSGEAASPEEALQSAKLAAVEDAQEHLEDAPTGGLHWHLGNTFLGTPEELPYFAADLAVPGARPALAPLEALPIATTESIREQPPLEL